MEIFKKQLKNSNEILNIFLDLKWEDEIKKL